MNETQNELLKILVEFDRICKKEKLKYTLAYGTLLGAIRHSGFIPWDDDIDVIMLREDFEAFSKIVLSELNKNFIFQTHDTESEYFRPFAKIRLKDTEMIEKNSQHLDINHGFWLDIFILDQTSNDFNEFKVQFEDGEKYNNIIRNKIYMHSHEKDNLVKKIVKDIINLRNRLFKSRNIRLAHESFIKREKVIKRFINSKYNLVFNFSYLSNFHNIQNHVFDKSIYLNTVNKQFEGLEFPVPKEYDQLLTAYYGDYMKLPDESDRITHT